jgi:putative Mg2+ transporter-C (MgtC) family protein
MLEEMQPFIGVALAAVLSLIIGLEREFYAKAAGMRTYMLVGMGSALFTVISKYGFLDAIQDDFYRLDGARVAAQVVSGVGFLGAGLIFVRKDAVRGLTTAAGVWFVAAVGMAAGAGIYWISASAALFYLVAMFGLRPVAERMPHAKATSSTYVIHYLDGHLRNIMETVGKRGAVMVDMRVLGTEEVAGQVYQIISISASGSHDSLIALHEDFSELDGVITVSQH